MTEEQLHVVLNSGRLSKAEVSLLVQELSLLPELTGFLLQEVFEQDKLDTFNASWTFDHLMRKKLVYLLPHLDVFTLGLPKLTDESTIRSMAHVCEFLCEAYFKTKDVTFVKSMNSEHLERIMTTCFDWFIGPHKVAAKVFAMSSLFYLGAKFDWIRQELKQILQETIAEGTSGYKSRAKKTLDKLTKLGY